jgi:Protein of unknown function (DUF3995)
VLQRDQALPAPSRCAYHTVWYVLVMQTTLTIMSVWAFYVLSVHLFAGEYRVVRPFRGAEVEPFARGTMLAVWHLVTWSLLALAVSVSAAALTHRLQTLVVFAGILSLGYSCAFATVSKRELGAAVRLPQWLLLGPLAVGLFATESGRPAAIAAATLIALLGLAHIAWLFGVSWPARDRGELAKYVLPPSPKARPLPMPGAAATTTVALVLLSIAATLLCPDWLAGRSRPVALGIAFMFFSRALFGWLYWAPSRFKSPAPFLAYDRWIYSPGCALIAALVGASAVGAP